MVSRKQLLVGLVAPLLSASIAFARTDLTEDYTDFPSSHAYKQQERYAARTECEVQNFVSSLPAAQQVPALPQKLSLVERLSEALQKDCGKVRLDKNEIVCEDYARCTKEETTELDCEYCPDSMTVCIEGQMRERWRFNPNTIGKVEALLIDKQYLPGPSHSTLILGYALRPVGKKELYPLRTESAAREAKNLINYDEGGK